MADRVSIDLRELDELVADIGRVGIRTEARVRPVVAKGALNIKTRWAELWADLESAPRLAAAVTYDLEQSATAFGALIGPDKDRPQGALGNLVEFGSVNNAPTPGGQPALDEEAPRFEAAIASAAASAILARG
jgi:hypothetical protein